MNELPFPHRKQEIPDSLLWPVTDLGQALEYLAHKSGLSVAYISHHQSTSKLNLLDEETIDRWISSLAYQLGLESEPIQSTYSNADHYLTAVGPALLQLTSDIKEDIPHFIALLKGNKRHIHLIAQDGSIQKVTRNVLQNALWDELSSESAQSIQQMLHAAGVEKERHQHVQRAILKEILGAKIRRGSWLLRLPPNAPLQDQARQIGLFRTIGWLIGSYFAQLLLTVAAWWMIGQSALDSHFDWGWLSGWALLLITTVPFLAWTSSAQSQIVVGLGTIFKQRLMHGVLKLDPEDIRHQGAGQLLGRVLASDTVEQLGLASGLVAILSLLQIVVAVVILAAGIGGWLHASLLLIWVGITFVLSWFYLRRNQDWIAIYREMTNDLVEQMVGHRTRLAQEDPQRWHVEEDQTLHLYFQLQKKVDEIESLLKAFISRGWMLVGVMGLAYSVLSTQPTPAQIAISLGGILFAYQALTAIILGLKSIISTRLAWSEIKEIFLASTNVHLDHSQDNLLQLQPIDNTLRQKPILTVRDIDFRYSVGGRLILQNCNLEIYPGDRLLLEGPSGGGKSTLVAILAGLRVPESGLLLLHGADQKTLGLANWRRNVVAVPQFHENYVLTGTFAFNLLMGRRWPPQQQDLIEAESICRELGLGKLLDRMPAGLQQMVGESGWQLSHGERSRLYIARAILQRAELVIMDESFGALDPESLEEALGTVLAHVPTLVVIAHP